MARQLTQWLGTIAVSGLVALGLPTVAPAPAQATVGITQPGPFEAGNLLDYANSDFEGAIGNWTSVSNATLTDDTTHSFLHNDSLLDSVPAAGTSTFKLGNASGAVQIPVTQGNTYTVGAYFKIPAVTGQSLTFGLGFFNASGTWLGWGRTGSLGLTSSGKWQYVSGQITAPANAASVIGSPEVTYSGATASEAINMDEAAFVPYRAAQIIGAHGNGVPELASDWLSANAAIGPLQSDKDFWDPSQPLPGKWNSSGNTCYEIEQSISNPANWPACVIAYKVKETEAQLAAFFTGLPAAQQVIMVWWQEPENDTFSGCAGSASGNGPNFVCYFEQQSGNIRQAANDAPNVFVAMDAETYQYGSASSHDDGTSCSFIPPTTYTDFYLADHYDESLNGVNINGESLPNEIGQNGVEWSNWLSCVQGINKPIGLAEYGQDCTTNPDQAVVTQAITADGGYLQAIPKATEPTIMWEYWYSDSGFTTGPGCEFDNSAGGITEWQSLETQNGGG
jgi:hypothetical protein